MKETLVQTLHSIIEIRYITGSTVWSFTLFSLFHTYEVDTDASEVSMRRAINFVVKQTQTQAVHTLCKSKRRKHVQKGIQREKQIVGSKIKGRNDIIKKTMDEDETLMTLGFLLIWKRQRNKQKVKKNKAVWGRDIINNGRKKVLATP